MSPCTSRWASRVFWHNTGSSTCILFFSISQAYKDQCPARAHGNIIWKMSSWVTITWYGTSMHQYHHVPDVNAQHYSQGEAQGTGIWPDHCNCLHRLSSQNPDHHYQFSDKKIPCSWAPALQCQLFPSMHLPRSTAVTSAAIVGDRSSRPCTSGCLPLAVILQLHRMCHRAMYPVWQMHPKVASLSS